MRAQQWHHHHPCQPHASSCSSLPMAACFSGRTSGDTRMLEMYAEYADIASADEAPGRMKARLSALSAFAESQGLSGPAAIDGLQRLNVELHWELLDTRRFTVFYCFVFFMCRDRGQKSLSVNTAVEAWQLVLTGRFRLLDQWCAFVQKHQRHAISEDTWRQVLEFSRSVHEDLSNYDPEGAWPVLVDDFVDSMYRKPSCSGCSAEESSLCTCKDEADVKLIANDISAHQTLGNQVTAIAGMAVSVGSKRRWSDPRDEAAEAESVNCIAQRLAEMPSPLSCKRVRSSTLVDTPDPMEEILVERGRGEESTVDSMELPEQSGVRGESGVCVGMHSTCSSSEETIMCLDSRQNVSQSSLWSNQNCTGLLQSHHSMLATCNHPFGPDFLWK